nr:hypothetical protein [Tanacetum cinerariifolium]
TISEHTPEAAHAHSGLAAGSQYRWMAYASLPVPNVFITFQIEAELAVRQFETAQYNVQRAGRGEAGRIELGYVASAVFSGVLQRQVGEFRQRYADVDFILTEYLMPALPRMI